MYGRTSVVAALVLLAASSASAQVCMGNASYSSGPMQVGGGFQSADQVMAYQMGLSMGRPQGLFGGAQLASVSYDGLDGNGTWAGLTGGYQIPVASVSGLQLCPVANLQMGWGPEDLVGPDDDLSQGRYSFGVMGGMIANKAASNIKIIPTGGISWVRATYKVEGPGGDFDASENYFQIDLGVGFVFNSNLTLRPSVNVPVGREGDDENTFGLGLSYNFGRTR
jgi:hypothetical protein